MRRPLDAVVIGGGFYGAAIAIYLVRSRGLRQVALIERGSALLARASFNNQARVHNGYHYPRSFTTAYRSRLNLPRFVRDWPDAVKRDFTKIYAIALRNSKVTARQFTRFCRDIGAKLESASGALRSLFEPRLIEDVFLAEEYAFDAAVLAACAEEELRQAGVDVRLRTRVARISLGPDGLLEVAASPEAGSEELLTARVVCNCTYSGLNQLALNFPGVRTGLKHEIAELALVQPPAQLLKLGVTVMDGPFFSMMPFPARRLHTLSHVRYTPHLHWIDQSGLDPYQKLDEYDKVSRVDRMVRDAARYMPAILDATYRESLFEVKTVLMKNEADDGRPILFEKHAAGSGAYSILGGKVDNIYDVLEKLDAETF